MFETRQISYINTANYNTTFDRFDLEDKNGEKLSLFTADFTGFKFKDASGEAVVSEEAMTAWLDANPPAKDTTIEVVDGKTLVMTVSNKATEKSAAIQLVLAREVAKVDAVTSFDVPYGTAAADIDATVKALIEDVVDTDLVTVAVSGTAVTLTSKEDTNEVATPAPAPITINKLGAIGGTVTYSTNPVAGAVVEITVGTDKVTATTAADGTYTIANVPAGSYTVTVKAEGYIDGTGTATVGTDGVKVTVDVTLSKDITAPTIDSVTGTNGSDELTIDITEDNELKDQVSKAAFTVTVNGLVVDVTDATIDTTNGEVTLKLETAVSTGDNVSVKYEPTGSNDIEDASGNKAVTTIVSVKIS